MALSKTQFDFLNALRAAGGVVTRYEGGFWAPPGKSVNHNGAPEGGHVGIGTIRALEKKGLLARANRFPEEWADDRRVVE